MKLFSRNKETTDPAIIIDNSLTAVADRITDSLEDGRYHWNKPWLPFIKLDRRMKVKL